MWNGKVKKMVLKTKNKGKKHLIEVRLPNELTNDVTTGISPTVVVAPLRKRTPSFSVASIAAVKPLGTSVSSHEIVPSKTIDVSARSRLIIVSGNQEQQKKALTQLHKELASIDAGFSKGVTVKP